MTCPNCADLITVHVVDFHGKPVGACGFCGVLARDGISIPSVAYRTHGDHTIEIRTITAANVKLAFSAAATFGPVMRLARKFVAR